MLNPSTNIWGAAKTPVCTTVATGFPTTNGGGMLNPSTNIWKPLAYTPLVKATVLPTPVATAQPQGGKAAQEEAACQKPTRPPNAVFRVKGAGTENVNGFYELNGETNSKPRYRKPNADGSVYKSRQRHRDTNIMDCLTPPLPPAPGLPLGLLPPIPGRLCLLCLLYKQEWDGFCA